METGDFELRFIIISMPPFGGSNRILELPRMAMPPKWDGFRFSLKLRRETIQKGV